MKRSWWIGGLLTLVIILPLWRALSRAPTPEAESQPATEQESVAIPVSLVRPQVRTVEDALEVTGTLKAANEVKLSSKVAGRVAQVLVEEGQRVSAGQVVVRLDTKDLQSQVKQAEAGVEMARARLQQTLRTVPLTDTQTDTQVKQAQESLKAAQTRLAQVRERSGITTSQTSTGLQQAQESRKAAEARYEQAKKASQLTRDQIETQIQQAKTGLEAARIRLAQAEAMAKVTPEQIDQQVAQAQAALASARARQEMVQTGARPEEKKQAEAAVNAARSRYENAKADYDRMARLFREGAIPQAQLDSAKSLYETAQAQLETAEQQLRLVQLGAREEERRMTDLQVQQAEAALQLALSQKVQAELRQKDVEAAEAGVRQAEQALALAEAQRTQIAVSEKEVEAAATLVAQATAGVKLAEANQAQETIQAQEVEATQTAVRQAEEAVRLAQANRVQTVVKQEDIAMARAQVKQAEAMLELARASLADAVLRAPVSGSISERTVEPGEMVSPYTPLLTLVNDSLIFFEATIPETEVAQVRPGLPVRVQVDALSNGNFQGTVTELLPAGDEASRNFIAKIALPNSDRQLKPGMFARGQIVLASHPDAILIPQEAVSEDNTETFVMVVRGDEAQRVTVRTGLRSDGWVEILDGLIPDSQVILAGSRQISQGTKVRAAESSSGQESGGQTAVGNAAGDQ